MQETRRHPLSLLHSYTPLRNSALTHSTTGPRVEGSIISHVIHYNAVTITLSTTFLPPLVATSSHFYSGFNYRHPFLFYLYHHLLSPSHFNHDKTRSSSSTRSSLLLLLLSYSYWTSSTT